MNSRINKHFGLLDSWLTGLVIQTNSGIKQQRTKHSRTENGIPAMALLVAPLKCAKFKLIHSTKNLRLKYNFLPEQQITFFSASRKCHGDLKQIDRHTHAEDVQKLNKN